MITLHDYLENHSVFTHMSDEHITPLASKLDTLLDIKFGQRKLGRMVHKFDVEFEHDDELANAAEQTVADLVYSMNEWKWKTLFDFIDAELSPWLSSKTSTTVEYGKIINDEAGGSDTVARVDEIAGFDSTDFVDDTQRTTENQYGRTDSSTQSGEDVITVEGTNDVASNLVDYTLQFWSKNNLLETILQDTAHTLCLAIY